MKVPRVDSVLKRLPQAERRALFEELTSGKEVGEVVATLRARGIVTSQSALYRFRTWYGDNRLFLEARDAAGEIAETLALEHQDWDGEAIRNATRAAFEVLAARNQDSALHLALARQRVAEEQAETARKRAELDVSKWEEERAAAKGVIGDTKLSPEERDAKLKEIFGIG